MGRLIIPKLGEVEAIDRGRRRREAFELVINGPGAPKYVQPEEGVCRAWAKKICTQADLARQP
jgi:hypothetical protein